MEKAILSTRRNHMMEMQRKDISIIKKNGTRETFDGTKIVKAIHLSAGRAMENLSQQEEETVVKIVLESIPGKEIPIVTMHALVENALEKVNPKIAKCYKEYRNYKRDFVRMIEEVKRESEQITFGDNRDNANSDSELVSTKRALIFNSLEKKLYDKFFLSEEERQAVKDGYIYIHDMSARLLTMNCCLFDMEHVLKGGFTMGNLPYTEPTTLDTAFDVMGDVILSAAGQQYGGFTVPEVDKILGYYAEKSYQRYYSDYLKTAEEITGETYSTPPQELSQKAHNAAMKQVKSDFRQGWQGIEYKLNSVGSSRGDYPFVTVTFGLGTNRFERLCSVTMMEVHEKGQGRERYKVPVLFPKYVFLYDKNLHGKGCVNEDVFEAALSCSAKTMYPDWLSLTGEGYVADIYKKYGRVISPMGCRAFLSPWYERGGMEPADQYDKPIFVGRFNMGAISLNLPMIFAKAKAEGLDFYEVLDHYLEMIRKIHQNTIDYLGRMKAGSNPLAYCEGGFLGGHLKPDDAIRPLLKSATISFGITALNELQMLYNKKSLAEDGSFALQVMEHINEKIQEFKKEDHVLYAVYGTPAETLCSLQIKQFQKKYGIVEGVSDRAYVSNSFHCHVTERISPIKKQDLEYRFWNYFNGGKIQYVRYPLGYNLESIRTLVLRAMEMGFYEGVNMELCYCRDCGYEQVDMGETCPTCGSKNLIKVDRMNGYLGYSLINGKSRYNDGKLIEISERVSM